MLKKSLLLLALLLLVSFVYITFGLKGNYSFVLELRLNKVLAIIISSLALASATLVFQTITNNRILSPSTLGIDSIYILINTLNVFIFSDRFLSSPYLFAFNLVVMIVVSLMIYLPLLRNHRLLNTLLLIGIILSTLLNSITTFISVIMDPNEFLVVQSKTITSFSNINESLLMICLIIIPLCFSLLFINSSKYDVLSLGHDNAISLGLNVQRIIKYSFVLIIILVACATALVGPLTFLGFMACNLTYQAFKTYRHKVLLINSFLIGSLIVMSSLLLIERFLGYGILISSIINLFGGIYFIFSLVKEERL